MRNMQHNKNTTNSSEIEAFAKDLETLTNVLGEVTGKFRVEKSF
jgi:hypothetical protein